VRNSLEKVFCVLELVASCDRPVSLKELAARTGHHPSTLSRILSNLVEIGYVRKDSYREFSLDLGLVPLGQKALSHFPLPRVANPLIASAAAALGAHGALAGLHRGRLVYLFRTRLQQGVGPLVEDYGYPLHASNCGRVILASLEEAEARALLERSLREAPGRGRPPRGRLKALTAALGAVRSDGYSWQLEKDAWNAASPLGYRGRTFAVSLHGEGAPPRAPEKVILACSLLARRIEAAAAEPSRS
jgi:DNA-binding IclR family transcriptional regulator